MKLAIICAASALALVGCVPKSELEKAQHETSVAQDQLKSVERQLDAAQKAAAKNPTDFVGLWRCQQSILGQPDILGGRSSIALEASLGFDKNGKGGFKSTMDGHNADAINGQWEKIGDYVVVEGTSGGFAAFKVASKTESKMTLLNREGKILEFTKIK